LKRREKEKSIENVSKVASDSDRGGEREKRIIKNG